MAVSTKGAARTRETNFGGIRLDLAERSFYRFSILATQINRCVTGAYVHKFGRPAHGWKVLTLLGRFGPMSVSEVTTHASLEIDKVTRILDSLGRQGLTIRRQDRSDKRRMIVHLTSQGRKVVRQIETMIYEMEREFLISLTADEREAFYTIMDKLQARARDIFTGKNPWKKFV
jgi:MarR family transcriptional regulator, lower aerobic nicotinate degradation pathway regulator